jgi:hypothetical protein
MTFVGKILVIIITVLALFFLALSTVVFTTATNWKDEATTLKTKVSELETKVRGSTENLEAAKKDLDSAKLAHEAELKNLNETNTKREDENRRLQDEITKQRAAVAVALENEKASHLDAEAQRKETVVLRENVRAVQTQANEVMIRLTELNDRIRLLERDLGVATGNNKDLRDRVARLQGALTKAGLPSDPLVYAALASPPPELEGVVRRVNAANNEVEISVGADDGVVVGHELNLFRTQPQPDYLGKIRIISVDHDQAVGSVVGGKTLQGKRILEGDLVATQIRPRG